MAKIKQIVAREILNSNGIPTIEATAVLTDGSMGTASCPTGVSIGKYEALEIRDKDEKRFEGLGVLNAILNIKELIEPNLLGMEANKQQEIDRKIIEIDATTNKGRLGANATLCVSMAIAKAAARSSVLPLFLYLREFIKKENTVLKIPTPLFNLLNGGIENNRNFDFQEFLLIPASSTPYEQSLIMINNIYSLLKKTLEINNLSSLSAFGGGFAPKLATNQDGLIILKKAIDASTYKLGFDVFFGINPGADGFYSDQAYHIKDKPSPFSSKDLIELYLSISKENHLLYLEDGLSEDDWDGWQKLCFSLSQEALIAGSNLTATNPYRLQEALNKKAITAIVIKPNQIGTVIEALAVVEMARQAGLKIIVSRRNNETNDDFIADFAVAVSSDYVKFGPMVRGENVAKYNRLLQIEQQIKSLQIK